MEVRIDKWLWAMRIFKTRSLATEACKKGRVTIGGNPVKPSRSVSVGETIEVRRPPVTYSFKVLGLTQNRLGAKLVPDYMLNVTPKEQLDVLEMAKIAGFIDRRKGLGRPTKREGREMKEFTHLQQFEYDSDDWDHDEDLDQDGDFDDPHDYEDMEEYLDYDDYEDFEEGEDEF